GHSLKRDMYGNDTLNNGFLAASPSTGNVMYIVASTVFTSTINGVTGTYAKLAVDTTSVPVPDMSGAFYNYDFTRWYIRLLNLSNSNTNPGGMMPDGTPINQVVPPVAQSFEVLG